MNLAMIEATPAAIPAERTLLIVEDDKSFLQRLARAMEARGFEVTIAESVADGLLQVEIDAAYVREKVGELAKNADLSKFVL